jgi:hypothetical protein
MDSSATQAHAQQPLAMDAEQFRALGHSLVDQIASQLASIPRGPVTRNESPSAVRAAMGLNGGLPEEGTDAATLLATTATQLFEHSLFNAHPRFLGYITSSPAPIGILGDLLASALNPNVGAWILSPAASEIEAQTIRWIAELTGYPTDCGGILVSGGNMANFVCFLAARAARAGWDIRRDGIAGSSPTARRIRIPGNAYLDSESRRSCRARHGFHSLDRDRRPAPDGCRGARARRCG